GAPQRDRISGSLGSAIAPTKPYTRVPAGPYRKHIRRRIGHDAATGDCAAPSSGLDQLRTLRQGTPNGTGRGTYRLLTLLGYMAFQGATDKEAAAQNSRQQYLAVLAEQRQCGAPQPPRPLPPAAPANPPYGR